jgi:hypothetical protein
MIGAAAVSFPAFAQTETPPPDDATQTAPETMPPAETTAPAPVEPDTPPPVDDMTAQPAPSSPPPSSSAPSDSAATPSQIAQIVEQEFPTYDGDANGELSETEFSAWMKKLRTATDPTVDPESEQVKSWVAQAFGAADADKSGGVSKTELIGFLSRGA